MYTYETLLHFLHILAAIVWVGSVLTLNVLAVRVRRCRVGLIGLVLSVALGATLIRGTNAPALGRLGHGLQSRPCDQYLVRQTCGERV